MDMSRLGIKLGPPRWGGEHSSREQFKQCINSYSEPTCRYEPAKLLYYIQHPRGTIFESLKRILEITMLLFTLSHKNGKKE
jgi:hypothetical protein